MCIKTYKLHYFKIIFFLKNAEETIFNLLYS